MAGVRGERYGVLVIEGALLEACDDAQRRLRERLAGLEVVYPRAHLTLASFARGSELREVQATLDRWARSAAALDVRVEGLDVFGPPHQVVYASVRKTRALERSFSSLRRERRARGLAPVGGEAREAPVAEWTPHLSLAYCGRLGAADWRRARAAARSTSLPAMHGTGSTAELVTYDADGERLVASFPLRGSEAG